MAKCFIFILSKECAKFFFCGAIHGNKILVREAGFLILRAQCNMQAGSGSRRFLSAYHWNIKLNGSGEKDFLKLEQAQFCSLQIFSMPNVSCRNLQSFSYNANSRKQKCI